MESDPARSVTVLDPRCSHQSGGSIKFRVVARVRLDGALRALRILSTGFPESVR